MNENTNALVQSKMSDSKMIEQIKITDTVHSWLSMLNRVIDVCNVVEYPESDPNKVRYENLFGFMPSEDKLWLDGARPGITPVDGGGIDVSARNVTADRYLTNSSFTTIDLPNNTAKGTVYVNLDSLDAQAIDANSSLIIVINAEASQHSKTFAQKLVSVYAMRDITIEYSGNGFGFVNNSVWPNIGYSAIGTPRKTTLLEGMLIVYRFTFIHSRVLVEVVENTQLIENYKTPSENAKDASIYGEELFKASSDALMSASDYISGYEGGSISVFINSDGTYSTRRNSKTKCILNFSIEGNSNGQWNSVGVSGIAVLSSEDVEVGMDYSGVGENEPTWIMDGRRTVILWSTDRMVGIKAEIALLKQARRLTLFSLSVVEMPNGRTYDE